MNTWYFILYLLATVCLFVATFLGFTSKPFKVYAVGFLALGCALAVLVRVIQLSP